MFTELMDSNRLLQTQPTDQPTTMKMTVISHVAIRRYSSYSKTKEKINLRSSQLKIIKPNAMPGVRHDKMKGEGATNKDGHQSCWPPSFLR
jgi:hypothetical protein